jgi:phosphatidylinositol alpha-mannosyltransferase
VRIALLSPYSWTYPGGVTRHIDALARELLAAGHEARILAPYDPDDERAARMHRGARPQAAPIPEGFVSLGRTVGIPANGAVSNLALSPGAVWRMRNELRGGGYDIVHLHEPVAPTVCWDALMSLGDQPLVGTFHTYSENVLTNGIAAIGLGGRRRMNRLHARIAVSEAAAWTARRFYGGRYRIVPNGVEVPAAEPPEGAFGDGGPLRILFIGQAVERKGLPILLRAFEALREHVPATLTIVGASSEEVAHMMLDDRGVRALGKVSEERKVAELAGADVVCAPSLHGESFGMVLTEAFAAGAPVVASDIPGYRDVLRDGVDGVLVAPGDPVALAHELRGMALDPLRRARMARAARERAERFAWPHVAREVLDTYEHALGVGAPATRAGRAAVRFGLAPADMLPRIPAERLPSLRGSAPRRARALPGRRVPRPVRWIGLVAVLGALLALARHALEGSGLDRLAASVLASSPGLLAAGFGLMCAAMLARAGAWHAILLAAPTWRPARRRDAMQGTFIGVLMSATLPARLGEPSRAVIVARRIGRARETLPVVLGTMVSQTLLNLLALAVIGASVFSGVDLLDGHHGVLIAATLAPVLALLVALLAHALSPLGGAPVSAQRDALRAGMGVALARLRDGLRLFAHPRNALRAAVLQLAAWGLQLMSCWLLLRALGIEGQAGVGGAAAVLFAVNATSVVPATPANLGLFQAACAAVLVGAYHVSLPEALAYGLVLQAVELATALAMGLPALVNEGLSWREVRLRTLHAAPVRLGPLPGAVRSRRAAVLER